MKFLKTFGIGIAVLIVIIIVLITTIMTTSKSNTDGSGLIAASLVIMGIFIGIPLVGITSLIISTVTEGK